MQKQMLLQKWHKVMKTVKMPIVLYMNCMDCAVNLPINKKNSPFKHTYKADKGSVESFRKEWLHCGTHTMKIATPGHCNGIGKAIFDKQKRTRTNRL